MGQLHRQNFSSEISIAIAFMVKSLRFKSSLILAFLITEGLLDLLSYDSDRELATSI